MSKIIYRCECCNKKFTVSQTDICEYDLFEEPKYCPYCGNGEKLLIHSKL